MVSDTAKHYPVLLSEIISIISPQHGGTFIDCTFGEGGYSSKILSFNKNPYKITLNTVKGFLQDSKKSRFKI